MPRRSAYSRWRSVLRGAGERVLPAEIVPVVDGKRQPDDVSLVDVFLEERIGRRAIGATLAREQLDDGADRGPGARERRRELAPSCRSASGGRVKRWQNRSPNGAWMTCLRHGERSGLAEAWPKPGLNAVHCPHRTPPRIGSARVTYGCEAFSAARGRSSGRPRRVTPRDCGARTGGCRRSGSIRARRAYRCGRSAGTIWHACRPPL